jgi:hypothetical protein
MSAEGKISGIFISRVPPEDRKQIGGASVLELSFANLVAGFDIKSLEDVIDRCFGKNGAFWKVGRGKIAFLNYSRCY